MTRTTKIRARDLNPPHLLYHFRMESGPGGYRHPEICIRPPDRMGEDILTFRWQINPAHDEDRFGRNTLSAYAPYAEMPLDHGGNTCAQRMLAKIAKHAAETGRMKPKDLVRILKNMGIRRYVYADNFRWVPRRYRGNERAFLVVQDAVATD